MRRMNGRSPPYLIIGFSFVCIVLTYKCWSLSSQNGDLAKNIEDLQTEIKIGGVKQDQYKKKMQALHDSIDDEKVKAAELKQKTEEEEIMIKDVQSSLGRKDNELNVLKKDLQDLKQKEIDLQQQLEEKESKIEILQKDAQHVLSLKNDADEVVAEKDQQINKLMRQIDQENSLTTAYETQLKSLKEELAKLTNELSHVKKEKAKPEEEAGILHIPEMDNKEPYLAKGSLPYAPHRAVHGKFKAASGIISHPDMQMIPLQPKDTPRPPPRLSIANLERQAHEDKAIENNALPPPKEASSSPTAPLPPKAHQSENTGIEKPNLKNPEQKDNENIIPVLNKPEEIKAPENHQIGNPGHPVIHEPDPLDKVDADFRQNVIGDYQDRSNVLAAPIHNPDENPDTAIDEEEKIIEDPSDDQDEEGKEIKKDLENNAEENYNGDYDLEERLDALHPEKPRKNSEPRGIGSNILIPKEDIDAGGEDGREDVNVDEDRDQRAHDRVYDTNIENRIRNLGVHRP